MRKVKRNTRRMNAVCSLMNAARYLREQYRGNFNDRRAARLLTTTALQVFGLEVYWTTNEYVSRDDSSNLTLVYERPTPRIEEVQP